MLCSHVLLVNIYFLYMCYLHHFFYFLVFLNVRLIIIFFCSWNSIFTRKFMCREDGEGHNIFLYFWFFMMKYSWFLSVHLFSAFYLLPPCPLLHWYLNTSLCYAQAPLLWSTCCDSAIIFLPVCFCLPETEPTGCSWVLTVSCLSAFPKWPCFDREAPSTCCAYIHI